jgi:hypothetical protein
MQHHGAPTRLLDFSYSIYVATYFAAENAKGDSAVWAIDGRWALRQAAPLLRGGGKSGDALDQMQKGERFQEGDDEKASALFFDEPFVRVGWPINAFHLNERLRIQGGVFMVPGDVRETFMTNLQAIMSLDAREHFLKIIIPQAEAKKAIPELFSMNLSRTSLFPGLDGFAQSLGVWNPVLKTLDW